MADHSFMPQVEVLSVTDSGRRRRWTDVEKLRIVEESYVTPRSAAVTARRHQISRSLLTRWRREAREGLLVSDGGRTHFAPVAVTAEAAKRPASPVDTMARPVDMGCERVEIVLLNGRRLVVAALSDAAVLGRLIQVVEQT